MQAKSRHGFSAVLILSALIGPLSAGDDGQAAVKAAALAATLPPAAPTAYILQRGDDIQIKAFNIPELDQAVRIRPDGNISLMLLHDVTAAGMTTQELGEHLSQSFAHYYRNPKISVIVTGFSMMSVYVGGEVQRPGLIPLRGEITALQAVLEAGGLKETSKASTVMLLRTSDKGESQSLRLNVLAILSNKQPDIALRPSDILYVEKSNISVYVGGEVVRPGLLPLNGELTAAAAVFQAGGLKESAKGNTVMLIRNSGNETPTVTKIALNDIFKGKPDMVLQPFDILFVPRSRISRIDKFIDQYIRQVIPINVAAGFSYIFGTSIVP